MKYLILLTLLSGCGAKIDVDQKVHGSVDVNHKVSIDPGMLSAYFKSQCVATLTPGYTPEELELCIANKTVDFYALTHAENT